MRSESNVLETNQGEIKIILNNRNHDKIFLYELGLEDEGCLLESGLLRIVVDFTSINIDNIVQIPTIQLFFNEEIGESHWQCDFNRVTILDKVTHHGHSVLLLLDKKKMQEQLHHHINKLIIHAEFAKPVSLDPVKSFFAV